jgi:preprotein translocase subunit SecG
METTDSAMKRTMTILMTTLFAMFLGIIYLANYVS